MSAVDATSYTDYLLGLTRAWPELDTLHSFMRSRPYGASSALSFFELTPTRVECSDFYSQEPEWREALHRRNNSAKARICIFSCKKEIESLDKEMLDACAALYDIDPFFLLHSFYQNDTTPASAFKEAYKDHIRLPSQQRDWTVFDLSIYFVNSQTSGLGHDFEAFIMRFTYKYERNFYAMPGIERPSIHDISTQIQRKYAGGMMDNYTAILETWNEDKLEAALLDPQNLIMPLLELTLMNFASRLLVDCIGWRNEVKDHIDTRGIDDFKYRTSIYGYVLDRHRTVLQDSMQSLILWQQQLTARSRIFGASMKTLIRDFEAQMAMVQETGRSLEMCKNDYAQTQGMRDSKKAAEKSDSSAALTTLAFFFVPLSLITSIFGMNVQEFGSGNVPLWQAVVGAAITLVVSIFLYSISGIVSRRCSILSSRIDRFTRYHKHWWRFAVIQPRLGFWLTIFALTHPPDYFELALKYCGLDMGEPWSPPRFSEETTVLHENISPFWNGKLFEVCDITRIAGWDKSQATQKTSTSEAPNSSGTATDS